MNLKYGRMTVSAPNAQIYYLFSFRCSNVGWLETSLEIATNEKRITEKKLPHEILFQRWNSLYARFDLNVFPLGKNAVELFGLLVISALAIIV